MHLMRLYVLLVEIAQMEEKEGQLKAAMDAWEQAGKCYDAENAKA